MFVLNKWRWLCLPKISRGSCAVRTSGISYVPAYKYHQWYVYHLLLFIHNLLSECSHNSIMLPNSSIVFVIAYIHLRFALPRFSFDSIFVPKKWLGENVQLKNCLYGALFENTPWWNVHSLLSFVLFCTYASRTNLIK